MAVEILIVLDEVEVPSNSKGIMTLFGFVLDNFSLALGPFSIGSHGR